MKPIKHVAIALLLLTGCSEPRAFKQPPMVERANVDVKVVSREVRNSGVLYVIEHSDGTRESQEMGGRESPALVGETWEIRGGKFHHRVH